MKPTILSYELLVFFDVFAKPYLAVFVKIEKETFVVAVKTKTLLPTVDAKTPELEPFAVFNYNQNGVFKKIGNKVVIRPHFFTRSSVNQFTKLIPVALRNVWSQIRKLQGLEDF